MADFEKTERNTVRRVPNRGSYDKETVYGILDDGFLCHVGFNIDDAPFVIPTSYGREIDHIYLHGATTSRMLQQLSTGIPGCLTVTHLDGLVMARSLFHHSMNYRSAVVFGTAVVVPDDEKEHGLRIIAESVWKSRWDEARTPSKQELKATTVLKLEIESASAKVRTGPPIDDEPDYDLPIWAGVIPVSQVFQTPENDPRLQDGIAPSPSVQALVDASSPRR